MIILSASVGVGGVNKRADVDAVRRRLILLNLYVGDLSADYADDLGRAIKAFQKIFSPAPDGKIDPNGRSLKFLNRWKVKTIAHSVTMNANLTRAWELMNPILPEGSYCLSGIRSTTRQRELLVEFFTVKLKSDVIASYTQKEYDRVVALEPGVERDKAMHRMVNGVGQDIALPGSSKHELGKAFDIQGGDSGERYSVAKLVIRANPSVYAGINRLRLESNGCVHVEII